MKFKTQSIPMSQLHRNDGQIEGIPANPRFIRDSKFKLLKQSITDDPDMLELRPLLAYDNTGDAADTSGKSAKGAKEKPEYIVIAGNMRFEALKALKYKDALCMVIPHDTDKEFIKAVILKDNSEFGEWDIEKLCNEWDDALVTAAGIEIPDINTGAADDGEALDDNYDVAGNTPKQAKSHAGDVYQLGNHLLICGDSTDPATLDAVFGMDGLADLIVTDPPYNVDYRGKGGLNKIANDNLAENNFIEFLKAAFSAANEHLKSGGVFYICHSDSHGLSFRTAVDAVGWQVRECLIWNKNSLVLGRQDYQWKHEPILYGWKDGAAHYFIDRRDLTTVFEDKPDLGKMSKADMKEMLHRLLEGDLPTTVIDCDKPRKSEEHPTMKPVPLIGKLIKNSSRPGDTILDMFGGSGTTLIAAEQLHRRCVMVEYEPIYIDVIINRWETMTGKQARLLRNVSA